MRVFRYLVASGDQVAAKLLAETQILGQIFDAIVMKKTTHHHKVGGELISELAHLVLNLAQVRDEWCQNHIVSQNIVKVILYLCNEVNYGSYVCITALDALQDIIVNYEGTEERH